MTSESSPSPWDRLQDVLATVKRGQKVTVDRIVDETGLSAEAARMVLDGLAKAGLFRRRSENVFVRLSRLQSLIGLSALPVS